MNTVKDLRELYKSESSSILLPNTLKIEYVKWLEKKCLDFMNSNTKNEVKIDLSDLVGEYSLAEIPSVTQEIENRINEAKEKLRCAHCGHIKENETGLCLSCGKFPSWAKISKKKFSEIHQEWEDSFHCNNCGSDSIKDFRYEATYANGEEWKCLNCNELIMVDVEPTIDDF